VPDRHKQAKSKYTADRNMPGSFDGETVNRRRFMTMSVHTAGGIAAAAFTLPALPSSAGSRSSGRRSASRRISPTTTT
jgi:hypothetical protein